jgi:hypothetical protein
MSNESPIVRFGSWMGAIIMLISAPVSGYFLFQIFLKAKASQDWPSVPGVITRAEVAGDETGRYRADVSYTYSVGGRNLVGTRIRASDGEYNVRDGAVQAIQGLAKGQQINVYYDPSNPTYCLIQPGAGFQEYALLVVPAVMLGIALTLIYRLRKARPNLL